MITDRYINVIERKRNQWFITFCHGNMSLLIHTDDMALEATKPASRLRYEKVWKNFKEFSQNTTDLEVETPKEEDILRYIRHLRDVLYLFYF